MEIPHLSVLGEEVLCLFQGEQIKVFIDATLGAGGHTALLLESHPEIIQALAIDQDPTALDIAKDRLAPWREKVLFSRGNFRELAALLQETGVGKAGGLIMDLGVSSMQLDRGERGFSFMRDGPLDMRMDPRNPLSAEEIVNEWGRKELIALFKRYGEEPKAAFAADLVIRARERKRISTTGELAAILEPLAKGYDQPKKKINPATKVFQALRIRVNDELSALEEALPQAFAALDVGGLLLVISFHSLEDRIVKNYFNYLCSDKEGSSGLSGLFIDKPIQAELLTKKPLSANESEIEQNPRARSAKLRAVRKLRS